jgi:uncharacterized protein (TIGR04222 family)
MFPFDLPGPLFLVFYAAFAAVVLVAYGIYIRSIGNSTTPRLSELTADPYRIALLRAGRGEAVRVAIVNLVDRGLLEATGPMLRTVERSTQFVRRDLDKAILEVCAKPQLCSAVLEHPAVTAVCIEYESDLATKGLMLDYDERRTRAIAIAIVLVLLGGLAAARLLQAFLRGQGNVVFLIILGALACWLVFRLAAGHATPAGRRALSSLQTLGVRLKDQIGRLRGGGATNEALLLAAVFGIYALPATAFSFVENLFPKPKRDSSSSSCGSSDGGSGGCGGGGGCGGCGG